MYIAVMEWLPALRDETQKFAAMPPVPGEGNEDVPRVVVPSKKVTVVASEEVLVTIA